jgi:hypothetical protein
MAHLLASLVESRPLHKSGRALAEQQIGDRAQHDRADHRAGKVQREDAPA